MILLQVLTLFELHYQHSLTWDIPVVIFKVACQNVVTNIMLEFNTIKCVEGSTCDIASSMWGCRRNTRIDGTFKLNIILYMDSVEHIVRWTFRNGTFFYRYTCKFHTNVSIWKFLRFWYSCIISSSLAATLYTYKRKYHSIINCNRWTRSKT